MVEVEARLSKPRLKNVAKLSFILKYKNYVTESHRY